MKLDSIAPDLELLDHTGASLRLSDLAGQPVVLYFLRTFTRRHRLGHTRQLPDAQNQMGSTVFVPVGPGTPDEAASTRKTHGFDFPLYADQNAFAHRSLGYRRFWLRGAQQSGATLLDEERRIRFVQRGTNPDLPLKLDGLLHALEEMLGEPHGFQST